MSVFLRINGYELNASEEKAARFFLELASKVENQDEGVERLTNWIKNNSDFMNG